LTPPVEAAGRIRMLDTGVGIATVVLVCAAFLYLGISYIGRRRQSVEDYTVSRNHAPTNV
jgi:hypothetical protein